MSNKLNTKELRNTKPIKKGSDVTKWLMVIYFGSGACSLIDEVVWVRLMKLTLGNTVYASSIVISVFMAGLALGALIMGRYADRIKRRLFVYSILEMCVTLSAVSLPLVLRLADTVYRWIFLNLQPSPRMLLIIQVVISAVILLVPTMIMGSTLPLLGRYVTSVHNQAGRFVGKLYYLNMLGAALGCFLAGFVLIRMAGVMGTLYIAAGINLIVAFGGLALSRFPEVESKQKVEADAAEQYIAGMEQKVDRKHHVLMLAFFVSGLMSIGYEIVWMRSIVFLLNGYTYVFSTVLTVYLLGNVIGAGIGSRLSKKLKNPAAGFGISLICLGTLGLFYMPWLSVMFRFKSNIMYLFKGLLKIKGFNVMLLPFLYSPFLFLLPSIIMGIGFPLALQAWSNYTHKIGQSTGTVYGVNTLGAVLGGLVSGFVLIPFMGTQLSITLLGLAGIWLGFVMLLVYLENTGIKLRTGYLITAMAITILAVIIPSDLFVRKIVSKPSHITQTVQEGTTTTVSVTKKPDRSMELAVDGIFMAGDGSHRSAQKFLGHLGVLLNKNTRDVLSVGFGGGETTECLSRHNLRSIHCVEVAQEVVDVALQYFDHINLGDRLNENVEMIYMDAKNYLHLTERHYDIIINGADNHSYPGSAPLFTWEHFKNAREHLNPGGLFITKLHLQGHPKSSFESIIGTFMEVFPHATIWFPTTKPYIFFYLVGSSQQQMFSPEHIEKELSKEEVRNSVDYMNYRDSSYVLSSYIGDENDLERYLKSFHLNSDDKPYVEYNLDVNKSILEMKTFLDFIETVRKGSIFDHIDWTGLSPQEQIDWRENHRLLYEASTAVLKSYVLIGAFPVLESTFYGLKLLPDHPVLLEKEEQVLNYIRGIYNRGKGIGGLDDLLRRRPDCGTAWLVKSWELKKRKEINEALFAGEKAVQYTSHNAMTFDNLGIILTELGQADKAIPHFKDAIKLLPDNAQLHYDLGVAFAQLDDFDNAVSAFRRGLLIEPKNAKAQTYLGDFLTQLGRKKEAILEYEKALSINPNSQMARSRLNEIISGSK